MEDYLAQIKKKKKKKKKKVENCAWQKNADAPHNCDIKTQNYEF